MVPRTEREDLLAAWRALGANSGPEGWRTITIGVGGSGRIRAGRHCPDNQESLLVGFGSARVPPAAQLPQGRGFLVSRADIGGVSAESGTWIALSRQAAGSLDLFVMMAFDIVSTLQGLAGNDDARRLQVFLTRIRAWQDFMRRGNDRTLGPEAELGLFGELEMLRNLLDALPAQAAVDAWRGPLGGMHDFSLGTGAVEVKSTSSSKGFPVFIGCLEQLDDSHVRPIFLAGFRLTLDACGRTLPEQIDDLREILSGEFAALSDFENLLLHAGFLEGAAADYVRRFSLSGLRMIHVSAAFPRLTRANVPPEIGKVCYEIDIDRIALPDTEIAHLLELVGVI